MPLALHVLTRLRVVALVPLLVANGAAAGETVRGLVRGETGVEFTGIELQKPDTRRPVQNGGYPLDSRSASAEIFVPGEQRTVLRRFLSRYAPVAVIPAEKPTGRSYDGR